MGMPRPKMRAPADTTAVTAGEPQKQVRGRPFISGDPRSNVKGRPRGTPNLNTELHNAIKEYKIGKRSFLELMLERALRRDKVMDKLLDKLLVNATPEQQATLINSFEAALQSVRGGGDQQPETQTIAIKATVVNPVERLDTFLGEEDGQ